MFKSLTDYIGRLLPGGDKDAPTIPVVRLSGVITQLRQLSVAPLVDRAAQDLAASVVLPELDGRTEENRAGQQSTIDSLLVVLGQRADTLERAAKDVIAMPAPTTM